MKNLLLTVIAIAVFAGIVSAHNCVAIIFHDANKSSVGDADLPFFNVRWSEVETLASSLPIIMTKVQFHSLPGSELRFSGQNFTRIRFFPASSGQPFIKLLIYEFSPPNNATLHEMRGDTTQLLGKVIPSGLAETSKQGQGTKFFRLVGAAFDDLQTRAVSLDIDNHGCALP